jgi:hypothetical protein
VTNSDLIALSAAVVALLALAATLWQAKLARTHNRLSVKPHLDWFEVYADDSPCALELVTGSALTRSVVGTSQVPSFFLVAANEDPKRKCLADCQKAVDGCYAVCKSQSTPEKVKECQEGCTGWRYKQCKEGC